MCGIAGFAGSDRSVIERMTNALAHRGPDGNAIWTGDGAALGHCRLAILDPRLQTMGYGRRFLASLPPAPITRTLDDISRFMTR